MERHLRSASLLALWALWIPLYGVAVYLGLSFYFEPEQVATFWPASGLFFGILVIRPPREWPWIALLCIVGQVLADQLATQRSPSINLTFAVFNTLEPVTGAVLVRRVVGGVPSFSRLRDVLATTLIGAFAAPVLTSAIGAAVVYRVYDAAYGPSLQIWWAADALGILAVAPLVIQGRSLSSWSPKAWVRPGRETVAIIALSVAISYLVFFAPERPALSVVDQPYIIFPLLIWAALRLSPRVVSMIGLIICGMVVVATDYGLGPFMQVGASTRERVIALQVFLAVSVLSASVLCAVVRERRDAERRRLSLENQLRQSQRMEAMGQLAGGVAHDFNNLLMVIQSNLSFARQQLQQEGGHDETLDDLREADDASQRAAVLTRQLLLFSRRHPVNRESLDLSKVIRGLQPMLERLIGEHIELKFELEGSMPAIYADRGEMEQVVLNLAINARDSMPDGGRMKIVTAVSERSTHLSVSDTGGGISKDLQERIFEPFFTTKEVGKGTGLGLATVHGIVTAAGGSIAVESTIGHGSTFSVSLPASEAETGLAASARTAPERGTESVLVCEDEAALRPLLRRALEDGGYQVLLADDVQDALKRARSDVAIDVLVTDVVMPGLSGPRLVERVREARPDLPVLFISGYPSAGTVGDADAIDEGMLLRKPFRAAELRKRVRETLDRARRSRMEEPD